MTAQAPGESNRGERATPKVSVVDDDPDLLTFFKDLAGPGRFTLLGAYSSGREALASLPRNLPDVVFMDFRLPDMSGIECTKKLTTLFPGLKIIVITGHPDLWVFLQAIRAGAAGFVVKPYAVDETLATVKEVLSEGVVVNKTTLHYTRQFIRQSRHLDPGWNLTEREEQLLACILEGKSYKQIASTIGIGIATVHTHMAHLLRKMGVHSRAELLAKFLQP